MKVVQINATYRIGSTGKICAQIEEVCRSANIENCVLYSSGKGMDENRTKFSLNIYAKIQALKSRVAGNYGFNALLSTRRIIAAIDKMQPDIIHLHNIHNHDYHLKILFQYLKKNEKKVVWTFHDCWAFTGYCPNFDMVRCDHWKAKCGKCPQYRDFSWFMDRSSTLLHWKRELFSGIDLTIVTPSKWLADVVKQSFLGSFPVHVLYNGIDLSVFTPTESDFLERHGLVGEKVVLGVAFDWGERKGLDVMIRLAEILPRGYRIVLVGTNNLIDKKLPDSIISIHRTKDQRELAQIYSAADVFVNPTREEVLGLVNIEALACGTPVVTFRTGGSPEIPDDTCGSVVERDDIVALQREIYRVCETMPYSSEACIKRARKFDMKDCYKRYIEIYEKIGSDRN